MKIYQKIIKRINYYQQLELSQNCQQKDIKQQYLKLAKIYHPDLYKGNDRDRFNQIKQAYDVLRIPEKRRKYDSEIMNNQKEEKAEKSDKYRYEKNDNENKNEEEMYQKKQEEFLSDYNKFRGQKVKVTADQIIIGEDQQLRALNQEERTRYEYVLMKNNKELYDIKYKHQTGYQERVKDNIELLNRQIAEKNVSQADKLKRKVYFENNLEKIFKYGLVLFVVFTFPILITNANSNRQYHLEKQQIQQKIQEAQHQHQIRQIQSRMRFD